MANLLFVLCKENVDRLVKYTGFGNAAGLLANNGLLGGVHPTEGQYSSDEESDTEEYASVKAKIDPVTGVHSYNHATTQNHRNMYILMSIPLVSQGSRECKFLCIVRIQI